MWSLPETFYRRFRGVLIWATRMMDGGHVYRSTVLVCLDFASSGSRRALHYLYHFVLPHFPQEYLETHARRLERTAFRTGPRSSTPEAPHRHRPRAHASGARHCKSRVPRAACCASSSSAGCPGAGGSSLVTRCSGASRRSTPRQPRPTIRPPPRQPADSGHLTTPVLQKTVPVYLTALGTVTAYNTVTLHSRVDGQLMQVNFHEGEAVKQGQLLLQIDPRPTRPPSTRRRARSPRTRQTSRTWKPKLQRYTQLYQAGVVSKEQQQAQISQRRAGCRCHQVRPGGH